jgi:hypothetical protein
MPILGIIDSSKVKDLGAVYPLQSIVVSGSSTTSITFSNIPSGYSHLQLRWLARTSAGGNESWQSIRFNSNTSGYVNHILFGGGGGSAQATVETLANRINFGTTAGSGATANTFGTGVIDILDYANINKGKVARFFGGYDNNGSGMVSYHSGLWSNNNAITSITLGPENFGGVAYVAGSEFELFGIKGA